MNLVSAHVTRFPWEALAPGGGSCSLLRLVVLIVVFTSSPAGGSIQSGTSELLRLGGVTEIDETWGTRVRWERKGDSQTIRDLSMRQYPATSWEASADFLYKVVYLAKKMSMRLVMNIQVYGRRNA